MEPAAAFVPKMPLAVSSKTFSPKYTSSFYPTRARCCLPFSPAATSAAVPKLPLSVPLKSAGGPHHWPIRFASISTSLSVGGGVGGGGDGGGGGGNGGEAAALSAEAPDLDSDLILLHIGGMSCGGCAAKVKRILESQPDVSSATVNLEKEMAIVWPAPEVKVTDDWKQQLGDKLANHLVTCGFTSRVQAQGEANKTEVEGRG